MFGKKKSAIPAAIAAIILGLSAISFAAPALISGVWTEISPSWLKGTSFQSCLIAFDPGNRNTLYLTGGFLTMPGLVKSTDGGSTWAAVGTKPAATNWGDTVTFLDAPFQIVVDPANSQHMYCTEMSPGGGNTLGFWVTTNGGAKWIRTKGFMDAVKAAHGSTDVGHMSVDPTDFNHVLITSHYYWDGNNPAGVSGVFETRDGGATFIVHNPVAGMSGPSKAVAFLYNPALGIGSKETWLLVEDGTGMWRTTDAGTTWTKVYTGGTGHGGTSDLLYTSSGDLYIGSFGYMLRSRDNGMTWVQASGAPYGNFYSIASDGNTMYTGCSGANSSGAAWYTSQESDGNHWTKYTGTVPNEGVTTLKFDSVNRIMYSANAFGGVWALKVAGSSTTSAIKKDIAANVSAPVKNVLRIGKTGISVKTGAGRFFDVKGRTIIKTR